MQPEPWRREHPEVFFLDPDDRDGLAAYLARQSILAPGERLVSAARAGEGNMNCVVRAHLERPAEGPGQSSEAPGKENARTLIVKQSRPWVEKYPQFPAPWDRARREAEFYALAASRPLVAGLMPRLWHTDPTNRVLILEDLGPGSDYTFVYQSGAFSADDLDRLGEWLTELHAGFRNRTEPPRLANREMRELNHRHLFFIPLESGNGLDLDRLQPGLESVAARLRADRDYVRNVHRLSEVYLADGPCLLHGDVFPGSLLKTELGLRVIDPEFGFFGAPEFDVAVFVAHLRLARQPPEITRRFLDRYRAGEAFDHFLMCRLAGVEIMRRVIGYAQLPLAGGLPHRERMLALSRDLVLTPHPRLLTAA